ncbi:MAG: hypothetical protein P8O84_01260, partial [Synechococcus sp. cluster3_bin.96]|nr:hypothetical protein [Synechococcus sp. cluster3_bin.96]
ATVVAAAVAVTAAATAGDPIGGDSSSSRLLSFEPVIQDETAIHQFLNVIHWFCLISRQNRSDIPYFISMLPR